MSAPNPIPANSLLGLQHLGQSVWLDYIRRDLLNDGTLKRMVAQDGLGGMTSNPAIFEKAISGSDEYTNDILLLAEKGLDAKGIYEGLAIQDIRAAADILRPVYDRTRKIDGYVSLEVSPHLAQDTEGTLHEARRLWKAVERPNLMIKVPGTPEGIPAIRQLISEGLNINITLLFAQDRYVQVTEAYIQGLEQRAARGEDISYVASVASFFISRIDTLVDKKLGLLLERNSDPAREATIRGLMGRIAIANGKQTYQQYKGLFSGSRWEALSAKGAMPQRVLWASTSTKNPNYRDVLYVEELAGPSTVNTIPPATYEAFLDHGKVEARLETNVDSANQAMETLATLGISIQEVTDTLLDEAIRLFNEPFDKLLLAIDKKVQGRGA